MSNIEPDSIVRFATLPPKSEFFAMPRRAKALLVSLAIRGEMTAMELSQAATAMVTIFDEEQLTDDAINENLLAILEHHGYCYIGEDFWRIGEVDQ